MAQRISKKLILIMFFMALCVTLPAHAQTTSATPPQSTPTRQPPQTPPAPTHADILRGEYGPFRANNDLLSYDLDVRVDPEKKYLSGKNSIRFKMLKDDTRIQLDLHPALNVDAIVWSTEMLSV